MRTNKYIYEDKTFYVYEVELENKTYKVGSENLFTFNNEKILTFPNYFEVVVKDEKGREKSLCDLDNEIIIFLDKEFDESEEEFEERIKEEIKTIPLYQYC